MGTGWTGAHEDQSACDGRWLAAVLGLGLAVAACADYVRDEYAEGPDLAPPLHHTLSQPVPGPAGRVPPDWERRLN